MAPGLETRPATGSRCVRCGRPATVTIVSDDESGQRQSRDFCIECAESQPEPRPGTGRVLLALAPSVLIRAGALLVLLALLADDLGIRGRRGFGWRQIAGSEAGALVLVVGAFLRSGWLTIGGLALLVLSLGADHLRVGRTPGAGWREMLALGLGAGAVAVGLLWQRRRRAQAARDGRAKGGS
jgi:hypothetical protein